MTTSFHTELETGAAPVVAPMEEVQATGADLASDMEVKVLQDQIATMQAKAQQIENEIAQMLSETGGAANSSSEIEHARTQARDMRGAADSAKSTITNAPTDPKTGKKMISSQKVTSLSTGMQIFIMGADQERGAIHEASATTESHEEAKHAKATAGKTTVAKIVAGAKNCTHAAVCAVTGVRKQSWFGEKAEEAEELGSRVSHGVARRWNGFAATVTGAVSGAWATVTHLDPIGALSNVADVTVDTLKSGYHAVAGAAGNVVTAISTKASAAKAAVVGVIDRFNPFKAAPTPVHAAAPHHPVAHPKPAHAPTHVAPGAMEKAIAQAKSVISNSLPHISMPHLSDFIPSSVPSLQGVMAGMGITH